MNREGTSTSCRLSPWPFAVASLLLAVLTVYLVRVYSIVHWEIMSQETRLRLEIQDLITESRTDGSEVRVPSNAIERLEQLLERSDSPSGTVLFYLEIYHLTGVAAAICSAVALLRKPRWVGIVSLPFGLLGLYAAAVVM
jgi:cell division protein FtsL